MKKTEIEIKSVNIIENEIIIKFSPPLALNEALAIYENSPDPAEGNGIGLSIGPNDKIHIPFNKLSQRPVIDYYMSHFTAEGVFKEKIENEEFDNAIKFKTTLYDIEKIDSSSSALSGFSTPGALISLRAYNFLFESGETISKTITKSDNTFSLDIAGKIAPYKPFNIEAHGKYFSPTQMVLIEKASEDVELIVNGSFQNGLYAWLQNPYISETIKFTQKEGHGNFKLNEEIENEFNILEAAQFVVGPESSRFRMSCEVRVHSFYDRPFHAIFFGQLVFSGTPAAKHIRYDVRNEEIGTWIPLSFESEFSRPWEFEKYGFTTDGIGEMDVRNITMIEI